MFAESRATDGRREREALRRLWFYGTVILLAYLLYLVVRPFLVPLAWGGVLAICFYPIHERVERRLPPGRAALVSTLSVALLVIIPMLFVGSVFASEASQVAERGPGLLKDLPAFAQRWIGNALRHVPGGNSVDAAAVLDDSARRAGGFISSRAPGALQDLLVFLMHLGITMFALFFLLRDARSLMNGIRRLMPMGVELRERLIDQTRALVSASITATLAIAAIEGLLGGIGFRIFGVPAPVFWGVVMTLFCLLPLGSWVVWGPAAIWLMATGSTGRGVLLLMYGIVVVTGVGHLLRPMLLSGHSQMNGLLLFISLLGGVAAFGSVGLALGPVVMATVVALFDALTTDNAAAPEPDASTVADAQPVALSR